MKARLLRLLAAADAAQQRRRGTAVAVAVVRKMIDDQGNNLAALIAYYGFLSLFPLLLVFAAVLGFVFVGSPQVRTDVLDTVARSFPSLSGYVDRTVTGNDVALGFGLVGALWAGLGVTRAVERAMNAVWDIPRAQWPGMWRSRLRGLAALAVLGATILLSTGLAALQGSGALAVATGVVAEAGTLALNVVLYLLALRVLTNRHLSWRQVLPGALLGAAGWTVLQNAGVVFTHYMLARSSRLYGSLGAVLVLIVWIYIGAQITLYAAQLNVVLDRGLWPRSLSARHAATQTDADRRAVVMQASEASSAADETVTVSFGGSGAPAADVPVTAVWPDAAVTAAGPDTAGTAVGPDVAVTGAGPGAGADPSGSDPGADPAGHRARGLPGDVGACAEHLLALERLRRALEVTGDHAAHRALVERLCHEAAAAALALERIVGCESDLASSLARKAGWPPSG